MSHNPSKIDPLTPANVLKTITMTNLEEIQKCAREDLETGPVNPSALLDKQLSIAFAAGAAAERLKLREKLIEAKNYHIGNTKLPNNDDAYSLGAVHVLDDLLASLETEIVREKESTMSQ